MVPIIFMSTFLLQFTVSEALNPQYILWVPSVMQSHSTEQACLHLLNLNESVSLSVVLEYDGSNSTIFDQTVEEDNFYACANFEVSHTSPEQMAFVTLLVKGDTLKIFERRSVALSSEETVTFVQTDKPIYKSGENVKLRIVTLDTKFLPINEVYPLITLQDPQDNRIFQWQNVTSSQNITELSFQLILEPVFGDYSIVVKEKSGKTLTHQFTVNRNVLPKFEVKVSAPQTITISDDEFQVSTCAKYTFGQPVHGKVHVQVCREFFSSGACEKDKNEICEQFVAQLKNGCVSQIINTKVFQLYRSGLFMSFYITTTVTEIGTGVQISEKSSIFITPVLGSVSFKNMDPFYRRGISYFGTLKFSGPNSVPMVNKLLQLELNDRLVGNYTTDENGEAQFSIDTSDIFDPEFRLKATYVRPQSCYLPSWLIPQYMDGLFLVQRFYSRTSSFLMIEPEPKELRCDQEKIVTVHYSLNSEAYRDDSNINFFYLVSLSGESGNFWYSVCCSSLYFTAWKGNISFPINISADLAPVAVMLVYTLHPNGEIIADSVKFQVEKCFKNKVSIKFSKEQGLPGSSTGLHLQASPDSVCALRAVDKSILLKSEQQLSAESVYNMLPNTELDGYFYRGLNLDDGKLDPCIPQKDMFYNGLYYIPVSNHGDGDTYDILKDMGLKVFTNLHYRKPEVCSTEKIMPYRGPLYLKSGGYSPMYSAPLKIASGEVTRENFDSIEQVIIETVRTNFPETWIWDLVSIDSSGSANLSFTIPDTITQWEANGFCVNGEAGFGISSTASLEASQPFFVEITSPSSVVRNERSDLIVSVFSYLNTCVEIFTQLEASQDFEAYISTPKDNSSEIIQAAEKKTYVWTVTPKNLGKVNITIVAESKQSSACPNEAPERQNLNWKDTVIKSLLVQPEGIEKEMTQSFLICTQGTKVSRQIDLNLTNDVVEGSTRAFFTVVGDILGLAIQNLENLFQMPYGGGEQNIALLASDTYILDYLKSTKQLTEEIKSKALFFLSNGYQKQLSFKNLDGSYSMFWQRNQEGSIWLSALTFKTFAGMKKYVFIDELVQRETLIWLASKQKIDGCFKSDGKLFNNAWEVGDEEDIVLTAYIVAAFLEAGLNFTFPALRNGLFCLEEALENGVRNGYNLAVLAYAFALAGKEEQVKSLLRTLDESATKLSKYYFHFSLKQSLECCLYCSVQDTPICLLATTRYMNLIFSDDQVTVSLSSEEFSKIFQVNSDNHLLVQRSELTKAGGQYTVDVEGQGCAFIQATLRYNVLLPKKESGFSLSLQIVKKNSSDVSQSNFDLTVTLRHIYPCLPISLKLENNGQVMKSEFKNDHVLFYLENVSGTAKSFTFSVEQINHVANIQPAPVMVYDYYEKDEYALASYNINSVSVSQ
nr:LOW QUALITY PROTEIN: ovostatin homolog 2-like [Odocoileus virginianus texanus]